MTTETIATRTVRHPLLDRYAITATVALHQLGGNPRPHFSATAEIRNLRRKGDNQIETCGYMPDAIRLHFPSLAPVVLVHLSDDRGEPMHAIENALYWLGRTQWVPYDRDALVRHLRVTAAEADAIRDYVENDPTEHDRESLGFMVKILHLRERWAAQAAEALAVIRANDD